MSGRLLRAAVVLALGLAMVVVFVHPHARVRWCDEQATLVVGVGGWRAALAVAPPARAEPTSEAPASSWRARRGHPGVRWR